MHARTTLFEVEKSKVDAGIDHVLKTAMPELEGIDGYVGMSLLPFGTRYQTSPPYPPPRCLGYSFWESEEKMQASANAVKEIRDRAVKVFGGSSVEVDEWEIAFLHDVQHKATKHTIGLASWHKVDPAEVDSWVDNWKKFIQGGLGPSYPRDFRSANAAVNRTSGRIMALLCYDLSGEPYPKELSGDSYAAMEEPDNPMRKQAEQIIEAIGHKASVGTAEDMWFFDFGLGHFWVP